MRTFAKIALAFCLLTAVLRPFNGFGQESYKEMPYDTLWQKYDQELKDYYYLTYRAAKYLKAIEEKAEEDHETYHYFKACVLHKKITADFPSNFAAQWDNPDSILYRCLCLYQKGKLSSDYFHPVKACFHDCFDQMPQNVPWDKEKWGFLVSNEQLNDYPFASLNDVLIADCLPRFYGDTAEVNYLISKAPGTHNLPTDRQKVIVFEILRLQNLSQMPSHPIDSCNYWKGLQRIEATYGADEAIDLARGIVLFLLNNATEGAMDYGERALACFNRILDGNVTGYYREKAGEYRKMLFAPYLDVPETSAIAAPAPKQRLAVIYTNIDTLYVSVFPAAENLTLYKERRDTYERDLYKYLDDDYLATRLFTQRFVLDGKKPGQTATTELWLDSLPIGLYDLYFHLSPELSGAQPLMQTHLRVSRMFVSSWSSPGKRYVSVNDRNTGLPLKSRRATYNVAKTSYTNRFGEFTFLRSPFYYNNYNYIQLHERGENLPSEYYLSFSHEPSRRMSLFQRIRWSINSPKAFGTLTPDRTLYRPGQTVFFKLLLMSRKGKSLSNNKVYVILKDGTNYRDTLKLTTSEFGSAEGSFQLPDGKVGYFSMRVVYHKDAERDWVRERRERIQCNRTHLEVADYRLPTFKVELLDDTLQPLPGDTFHIRGKVTALNGQPVRDASVTLHIKMWNKLTYEYHTFTMEDGTFSHPHPIPYSYDYVGLDIEAVATDLNGETHTAKRDFIVDREKHCIELKGRNDYDLALDSTTQWYVCPKNALRVKQKMPLEVTVTKLQPPAEYKIPVLPTEPALWKPMHSSDEYHQLWPSLTFNFQHNDPVAWPVTDTLYRTHIHSATDSLLRIPLRNFQTGNYRLTVSGTDLRGKPITRTEHFTVNDHRTETFVPYQPLHANFSTFPKQKGDKATVTVGSCLHNATVISDVYQGRCRLKTVRTDLDRNQKSFTVRTRRKGSYIFHVLSRVVQNGELHQCSLDSILPERDKTVKKYERKYQKYRIDAELTESHPFASPGSEEEWAVSIKDGYGKPIPNAELLAWMFDGSLYHLNMKPPTLYSSYSFNYIRHLPSMEAYTFSCLPKTSYIKDNKLEPSGHHLFLGAAPAGKISTLSAGEGVVIAWQAPVFRADNTRSAASVRGNRSDGQATMIDGMVVRGTQGVNSVDGTITSVRGERPGIEDTDFSETEASEPQQADIRFRRNFTETAFFYPMLHPDENGNVRFRFTLPDQYTRWEFYALAHSKGRMRRQVLHATMQSRLSLMLQSNAPRFFRERDTMELKVKITNRCDTALNGTAAAAFFDPETGEPLPLLLSPADSIRTFRCEANGTASTAWNIVIPEGITAVKYRLTARAGKFGDGEEKVLPVLPDRTLVTEAMNFIVPARTDTTLVFDSYRDFTKNLLTRSSLSLPTPLAYTAEFTTNPTWLALYALPDLITYPYECNEQVFSKLFAAATVLHALEQTPGMDSLLQSWRDDTLAATSPLLANEDFKELLLEETPWLRNAQSEEDQRRAIADLFQIDNLNKILRKNLNKLTMNQLPNGGWSWYGRNSYSGFITAHIAAGLFKLARIGADFPEAKTMAEKALRRMDKEHEEAYQQFLKDQKEKPDLTYPFTEEDVHYLYARSFAGMDTNWLKKPYVQNLLGFAYNQIYASHYTRQAEMALFLHRCGDTTGGTNIIKSLRCEAEHNPETGMYWHSEYSGRYYFPWYEAPVERQALLIEAFAEISPREAELTAMKQWLLQNKETHSWYSTKATTEAVYALLLHAPDNLLAPATTTISVGDTPLGTAYGASGYVKQTWAPEELTPSLANIDIRTDSTHSVFGACYWQYTEIPENVVPAGRGLTVRRTLCHQEKDAFGTNVPVSAEKPIRLGEKLTVRLELTSDRELEYVHVKDPRAAAFEPVNFRERWSSYHGTYWTESPRDAATHFFITRLPEGKTVIEYDVFATQSGDFSYGCATVECMYAPGHRAQSNGERVTVK